MRRRPAIATLLASACLWLAGAACGAARIAAGAPRIGIYGLPVARNFDGAVGEASAAGFDLAVVGASRDSLDLLQEHGMQGLVALWLRPEVLQDDATWKEYLDGVRDSVIALARHPALFAWYVADEPDGEGVPPRKMMELCQAVRALDPRTPLLAVFDNPERWSAYLALVDIVAPDPYLRRSGSGYVGPEVVAEWLVRMRRDLLERGLQKEVWVVLGAFRLERKDDGPPRYRLPTPEEFHAMAKMSRDAGVGGILVYSYAIAETGEVRRWDLPEDAPELWSAVRALAGER